ncbi:hypothetical protein OG562_23285 [Streptomyces sp. NBC_01275]|uniref:hypothetical protein n=1 Tax=Streptomyces sp. NBC_01275 TaxID=2903807 RepID=UPI002254215E|nr:hypothetical protein [Streptomyces sp. NBC_01275]MCX4763838.1 hypothetical protein [Streptomyces sp. NBC_01275]
MNYPVIAEHVLDTIQGGWWSRRRRRDDVPSLPPGAVYVFRVGGNYRSFPEGMVFDPSHPDVLDASSVSLVDTRARLVEVERQLPSVSEADNFTISATFTCQVTDPTVIARQGVIDVAVPLRAYLLGDGDLPKVSAGHRVEEINAVRAEVARRMTAYSAVVPPRVAGMTVEFVSAEVRTSESLRAWEETLRNERRTGQLSQFKLDLDTQTASRIADVLAQGSDHVDAFGIARQEIEVTEAAARIHRAADEEATRRREEDAADRAHARARETAEGQMRRDMVLTLLRQMGGSGDYVDYHQVLEQVLRETGGRPGIGSGATEAPMVEPGPAGRAASARREQAGPLKDRREGFVQNEEDLVD